MTYSIIQHFGYKHLPPELADVSRKFCELATELDKLLDETPEKAVALRKLLESKDAAVRSRHMDLENHLRSERINEVKELLYPHNNV